MLFEPEGKIMKNANSKFTHFPLFRYIFTGTFGTPCTVDTQSTHINGAILVDLVVGIGQLWSGLRVCDDFGARNEAQNAAQPQRQLVHRTYQVGWIVGLLHFVLITGRLNANNVNVRSNQMGRSIFVLQNRHVHNNWNVLWKKCKQQMCLFVAISQYLSHLMIYELECES